MYKWINAYLHNQSLDDVELQHTDSTYSTYLGVTFDKRQTWSHGGIISTSLKLSRKAQISFTKKACWSTMACSRNSILKNHIGAIHTYIHIRPYLEYGSTTFTSASKSTLYMHMMDKVQNQAMRLITGAMKSTSIKIMEET